MSTNRVVYAWKFIKRCLYFYFQSICVDFKLVISSAYDKYAISGRFLSIFLSIRNSYSELMVIPFSALAGTTDSINV